MQLFIGIIVGLLALVFLVVIHELGHAIAAIKNGVKVEEFGVGLPPAGWKKKLKNGIVFSLNWLPLGGFVKLKGEYDSSDKKGDYGAADYWAKTKILLAGVAANWLAAIVILTILAITGLPKILDNQFSVVGDTTITHNLVEITGLSKDRSAIKAGFKVGDKIVSFAGQNIDTVQELIDLSKANKGKTIEIVYIRDGSERQSTVTLGDLPTGGYFGANLGQREYTKSTWSAPITGVVVTGQLTVATFQGLGDMLTNLFSGIVMQFSSNTVEKEKAATDLQMVSDSVAGPIGILGVIFPQAQQAGLTQFMFLMAIISISLAAMNVLPIPALDGGRWFIMTIYKLRRKVLSREREEKIQMIGFMVLMGLILLVTIVDVKKIF